MNYSKTLVILSLIVATSALQAYRAPLKPGSSPYPPSKPTQTHFIQFFSSTNATKAEGMKNTLQLQGYPAFVFVNNPKQANQTYYQVQVGPFPTRDQAKKAKTKVVNTYPEYDFLNDAILKTSL